MDKGILRRLSHQQTQMNVYKIWDVLAYINTTSVKVFDELFQIKPAFWAR